MICVAALRLAAVFLLGNPEDPDEWAGWTMEPDSRGYLALAADLADGKQDSVSTRTPGYPALLALTGGGTPAAVLVQQAADLAAAVLIGLSVPRRLRGLRWFASTGYLLLPASFITSVRILPDTLLALAAAVCCYLWLAARGSRSPRRVIMLYGAVGLVCAAGVAVKPVFMFAPAVFAITVPFLEIRSSRIRLASVAALAAFSATGPLLLRLHNTASFGMDAVSAQDGYEQAGRVWVLTGRATQLEFVTVVKDSVEALSTVDGRPDHRLRAEIYRDMAMEEFLRNPRRVIVPHLTGWPRFFSTGVGNTLRYLGLPGDSPLALPLKAASALLIGVAPLGYAAGWAFRRVREEMKPQLLLAAAWMLVMFPVHGPLSGPRYGLIFFPALVTAGLGSLLIILADRRMGGKSLARS
jgi:hypothetical protein